MPLRPTVLSCPRSAGPASVVARRLAGVMLGCLVSAGSGAMAADAPVYRCGSSYSSQPCPGGSALDVADPRSAAQQRQARETGERDAALARQMTAQRQADEQAAPQRGAANLGAVVAQGPAKAASKPHQTAHKKSKKPANLAKPAKPASAPR